LTRVSKQDGRAPRRAISQRSATVRSARLALAPWSIRAGPRLFLSDDWSFYN
jgi:hypothetical protein